MAYQNSSQALMFACQSGSLDVVKFLTEASQKGLLGGEEKEEEGGGAHWRREEIPSPGTKKKKKK